MNQSFAENLKFKFHYNSLKRIVDSGLFKGDTQDLLRQKLSSSQSKQKRKSENREKVAQDKNQKQKKQSEINNFWSSDQVNDSHEHFRDRKCAYLYNCFKK